MKKKTTRKIRRNKRATTQRRKNRSYKRMKGGGVSTGIYIRDENGQVIEKRIVDAGVKKTNAFNTLANTKNIKKVTMLTLDDGSTIKPIELNNNVLTWAVYEEPSLEPTNLFANDEIAKANMFHLERRAVSRFSDDGF